MRMTQKSFAVDLGRCIGCNACVVSCKQFRDLAPAVHRRKVYELSEMLAGVPMRNHLSVACNHCDKPGCLANCPTAAYTKNADGIVVHDKSVCIGCKLCAWSCPYGVPCYDEEAGVMDKCDLCYERMDEGLDPVCVASCPLGAIKVIDAADVPEGYQRGVEGYPDTALTGANLYVKLPSAVDQVRR